MPDENNIQLSEEELARARDGQALIAAAVSAWPSRARAGGSWDGNDPAGRPWE